MRQILGEIEGIATRNCWCRRKPTFPYANVSYVLTKKCDIYGAANVLLISIHINAAGSDGKWHKATDWSAYTTPGITKSDLLAFDLYEAARKNLPGKVIRQFNGPKEPDFEENFYILKHTKCPAVLTENFFMDNVDDVRFLESRAGMEAIAMLHTEGITDYLQR